MATLNELFAALQKADAAGNTEDAKQIADIIRQQGVSSAPAPAEDTRRPEDVGALERIGTSLKRGFTSLGDVASGLGLAGTSVFGSDEETGKKMAAIKAAAAEEAKGTKTLTAADIQRIAEEKGIISAGTQVPSYIVEQVLQSAPQMAIPLAVGAGAAAVSGPFAPIVGPVAGIAAYGVQQFGNFLVRQAQEKDDPQELEIAKAALTAGGTAPIGYFVDRWTAGLGSLGSKEAGKQIAKELAARRAAGEIGAGAVAKEVGKRAAKGAGVGIIAEAPTEVLEQAAELWQAGVDLTSDKAMAEYKEAFFGAAAAGAGIGAGAKGIGAYSDYKKAKAETDVLGAVRSDKNAFQEAEGTDEAGGIDGGLDKQGVPVFDQQEDEGLAAGVGGAGLGDLEGNQLPTSTAGVGEESIGGALDTRVKELDDAIAEARSYIKLESETTTPDEARIAEATDYITQLEDAKRQLLSGSKAFNAPKQQGFDFAPADETTQRAIDTEMTETPGFALQQETGAAALPKADVQKVEEVEAAPRAKMMLVGTGANPLGPVESLLNSVKPASQNPQQQAQYKNEVRNFLDDMLEFIGQSRAKVARYAEEGQPSPGEGPDVSVPLTGPQREMRLNFLDKFFDSISDAPVDKQNLTSTLAQRFPGMSLAGQKQALNSLTNVPNLNTIRGLKELRAKFNEALTAFEGELMGQPVEEAAVPYKPYDKYTPSARVSQIMKDLSSAPDLDEQNKAATNYFSRWNFITAMRSAAFDLATLNAEDPALFKGQNRKQAELFREWVAENLPKEYLAKFDATVKEFAISNKKAEDLQKQAQKVASEGGVAKKYTQMIGRAPTGKTSGVFQEKAGLGKAMAPSKTVPYDFKPMHPAVEQALMEGNVDKALAILSVSGSTFQAGIAKRVRELGLRTSVVFNRQNVLAAQLLELHVADQRKDVFNLVQAVSPDLYAEYFADPNNFEQIRKGLDKLTDPAIEPQVSQLKTAYDEAIALADSSGAYVQGLDVINLNPEHGGNTTTVFLHELVHAATTYALDPINFDDLTEAQQKSVAEIKALYDFAKRTGLNEYGFKSVEEFVAEAFTNESFQGLLKSLPYAPKQNLSFWDKFTSLITKLFGLDNVLGYTLANANVIFQAPPALSLPVVAFNARKKASVLAGEVPTSPAFRKFLDRAMEGKPSWVKIKANIPYALQNMGDAMRKYVLRGFTLRQLEDLVGNKVSQLKSFIVTSEKMLDECNSILNEVKGTSDKWRVYQKKNPALSKTLSRLMLDATRMGIDPNTAKDPLISKAWQDIGTEGREIFNEVRAFYKDRMDAYIESIVEANKSTYRTTFDIESAAYKAETQALEQEESVRNIRKYFKKHMMPVYFPIRRFGQYSLMIGRGADKEFYMFESAAERNAFSRERLKELADAGRPVKETDVIHRNSIRDLTAENLQDFKFYQELQDLIDAGSGATSSALKADLKDKLEQMYFMLLPDKSVRKMLLNRKDTPGMSEDMLRAFESSATHIAYQHSRFKYAPTLHSLIDIAAKDVKAKGLEGTVESDYVNELSDRLRAFMNPPEAGKFTTAATSLSFLWYLSAPASAIVNMLGLPAVGLPVLAAKYKWSTASAKMAEYTSKVSKSGFRDTLGQVAFPSLGNNLEALTPIQQEAYKALVASGAINITLTHDILEKANRPSDIDQSMFQRAMGIAGAPFHAAEMFTREVMGMSAFDLSYADLKAKGYSDKAAFKKAVDDAKNMTYKALGDYSALNKPSFLQNQYVKVIFQFKQFALHMSYLLARSAYEGIGKKYTPDELKDIRFDIKNDHNTNKPNLPPLTDAELDAAVQQYIKGVRTEARNRLAGTLGMTFVFAGATGLPLWSSLSFIMNTLQAAFGEDDEEWDFDNWFKNWSAKTFGGFVGDSISRGVASQVLGADISSRMSLNDLWYRDTRKSSDEVTAVQNMMIQLMGPSVGLVVNTAEAVKQWNDGHVERALETASPAVIKNVMKGMRYEIEGRAVNLKGDELVSDISTYESIIQGLGFNPERIAQRQKSNIEMKTIEQKILNKRNDLMNAFFMAVDKDDDVMMERVLEKIERYNNSKGSLPISSKQLRKSVKTRYKNRDLAESTGGISINKKLIGDLEDMQGYGNPD